MKKSTVTLDHLKALVKLLADTDVNKITPIGKNGKSKTKSQDFFNELLQDNISDDESAMDTYNECYNFKCPFFNFAMN